MTFITETRAFLADLTETNTRDWFLANKARYDSQLREPALALVEALAPELSRIADAPVTTKLFRPNRDVRFSKDKTPYKTHLHMLWTLDLDAPQNPVMFFGVSLDYVTVGTGMMGFDKPVLENWRKMLELDGDRIAGIIAGAEAQGYAIRGEPALKRVPSPYAKDHPQADLLRRKGLTMSRDLGTPEPLEPAITSAFRDLWPVADLLGSIASA